QFFAFVPTFTGGVNVAAGDLTGDGKVEIIAAAETNSGPLVRVFSQSGAMLQSFFAYSPSFTGGVNVAARDIDGDGRADTRTVAGAGDVNGAVVGVPYTGALGTDRGAAYVAFCGPTRAVVIITLNALALGGLTPVGFENSAADYSVSGSGRRLRDASRTFRNRA